MPNIFEGSSLEIGNRDLRICIIASKFNRPVTDNLIAGAVAALEESGVTGQNIDIVYVPGAFEIPSVMEQICLRNIDKKKYDGTLSVGCVIKGETAHFEYICSSVSQSINRLTCEYDLPHGFCVLTCYTPQQAAERSAMPPSKDNNKGFDAALALLEMISLQKKIQSR